MFISLSKNDFANSNFSFVSLPLIANSNNSGFFFPIVVNFGWVYTNSMMMG